MVEKLGPQEVVELWAATAFEAWVDEDSDIFEAIKEDQPSTFELVKQAFMVGFAMGGGATLGPDPTELLDALGDLE